MVSPQFIEEQPVPLVDIKEVLLKIEKKDGQLNYISNKTKEYLEQFVTFSEAKKQDLKKKLEALGLVRLKSEHVTKIIDFLPQTIDELKVILLAYPLSMPKKDQEEIVAVVKAIV